MDLPFIRKVTALVDVPVIACGGAGTPEHACRAITEGGADAVAVASVLHYGKHTVGEIKARLAQADVPVRSSA
jgi:cyclase